LGIHRKNQVSPITEPEIRTGVANWKAFEIQLYCPDFKNLVKAQGNSFQCTCGKLALQRAAA
jgi:hypothetical protein